MLLERIESETMKHWWITEEMQIIRIKLQRIFPVPELGLREHNQFLNGQTCGSSGNFCERKRFKKLSSTRLGLKWFSGCVDTDTNTEFDGTRS